MPKLFETRAVLAARYVTGKTDVTLTHVLHVPSGLVLCGRVRPTSLADSGSTDPDAAPTCQQCYKRWQWTSAGLNAPKRFVGTPTKEETK